MSKLPVLIVCACLSPLLTNCAASPKVAVAPELPEIPTNIRTCPKRHVVLPAGDWTNKQMLGIIKKYIKREDQLESCVDQAIEFHDDLKVGYKPQG